MSRTLTAVHAIITDTCRDNRGDGNAFEEAVRRCSAEFEVLRKIHLLGHGVKFHIKLEVELPK